MEKFLRAARFWGILILVGGLIVLGWALGSGTAAASNLNVQSSNPIVLDVDPDVPAFVALTGLAVQRAQLETPEVTLRQVIMDNEGASFIFTDTAATGEFSVQTPLNAAPGLDQMRVVRTDPGSARYAGFPAPGMDLSKLRIGPGRVRGAISRFISGCDFSHSVLYKDRNALIWRAFCTTSQGMQAGWMDNQSGIFHAEPLAAWPSTATAAP